MISTGNITTYPALCASITASFVVLSNTINSVRSVLLLSTSTTPSTTTSSSATTTSSSTMNQDDEKKKNQHVELKQFINYTTQLQLHESTKLNLTAAYHLERLRLFSATSSSTTTSLSSSLLHKNEEVQQEEEKEENDSTSNIGSNDGNNNSTATTTIMRLLQESIHQLEIQLSNNIIQINDILEEMRCLATDIIIVD
jgi:hypothetical protein